MIEELKATVEVASHVAAEAAEAGMDATLSARTRFLAKYGPALIKAVELAEAALKADLLLNGGLPFVGTPAEDRFFEAIDAYDAAKKEANNEP